MVTGDILAVLGVGSVVFALAFIGYLRARAVRPRPSVPAAEVREMLRPLLRQAARMVASDDPSARSKLGGHPDLPDGMTWPSGDLGPRDFLAQIDLAELQAQAAVDGLPTSGCLFAFHDPEKTGAVDCVVLLHGDTAPGGQDLAIGAPRYPARPVGFRPIISAPPPERIGLAPRDVVDDGAPLWPPAEPGLEKGPQHKVGGWADAVQSGDIEAQCNALWRWRNGVDARDEADAADTEGSLDWRLIVQIDSDPDFGMNWGDGGCLYVFGRRQEIARADFSRTVTIWQSY